MKRGKPCTGNKESRKLESTVFVVVRGVPKSPTQVSTHAYTSEHTRVITKRLGHLMIVRLRGRVCGHLDCTLSGWLGSCEPSFLPSPPPSCVCASSPHPAAPGPACVPRRAPGTSRDFTVMRRPGQQPGPEGSLRILCCPGWRVSL